jgi:hypothetical protein
MVWARVLVIAVGAVAVLGPAAADVMLEPHRAVYRLSLAETQAQSPLLEVRGGLVIEWQLACDGWLSRQRLGFVAATEAGQGFSHDVRFSSWEAKDGSRLRYSVRSYENDDVEEEYRGEAWVKNGSGGVASFTEPEERDVKLPPGTIFPTDHLRRLLDSAAEGRRIVSHQVFDGWGFDALTQITSAITEPRSIALGNGEAQGEAQEEKGRAWPVSMAYYNIERGEDVPEFEAGFLLVENGVLRDLTLDYGDFRLDATLEQLELLTRPEC